MGEDGAVRRPAGTTVKTNKFNEPTREEQMKNPKEIITELQRRINEMNIEATACARKFMENGDANYKVRATELFKNIAYQKSFIKFVEGKEK